MSFRRPAVLLCAIVATAGLVAGPQAADAGPSASGDQLRPWPNRAAGETPSGQPVPRFVSLRSDKVNARRGPSTEYAIRWTYRREGLPVRVVAETETWRRVEDPFGETVWIARQNLSPRRTAMARPLREAQVPVRASPSSDARVVARLANGTIVELRETRGGWREVRVGRYRGWVAADELWGS
jgi:SH3-like domain-containing protein